jgi:low affinity Fe/Cu permease
VKKLDLNKHILAARRRPIYHSLAPPGTASLMGDGDRSRRGFFMRSAELRAGPAPAHSLHQLPMLNERSAAMKADHPPPGPREPGFIERYTQTVTHWVGSVYAFALAVLVVLVWAATGPLFNFNDTWQLVINTGTTIVTFLMVFIIQRSQNKDTLALHIKLNEVVAALKGASNRLIDVEDLSEDEIRKLHDRYQHLAQTLQAGARIKGAHSVEEDSPEAGRDAGKERARQPESTNGAEAQPAPGSVPRDERFIRL